MLKFRFKFLLLGIFLLPISWACNGDQTAGGDTEVSAAETKPAQTPALTVYKSPTCGCCGEWVTHVKNEGFATDVRDLDDMAAIKNEYGVGQKYRSCHTAVSDNGFVFEGHIPARYIQRFLAQPPANAIGLAVPGMPVGSPGMEMGDKFQPYQVLQLNKDGSVEVFAEVSSAQLQ